MKPSLGTNNPKQTTKPMMTMSDLEKYLVDHGIQVGTTEYTSRRDPFQAVKVL